MEPITLLQDTRIVLAVTGSIACYKAVDLASKLTQAGAEVDVIMTDAARHFVQPVTFQAVTGRPVYDSLWQAPGGESALPTHIAHVGLAEEADLLAVIPATANTLAKMAQGFADDLLTVTALAATNPTLVAPAMDGTMYSHPAVQANLRTLYERGVYIVEPDEGRFASGLVGRGRLPETPTLLGHIRRLLGRDGVLSGHKVVISAGGTREPLDPVRYLSNRSSGKQGYALAQAALDAGADEVVLVSTADLPTPIGARLVPVESAAEMQDAVLDHGTDAGVLVMAAAVADFRPAVASPHKIKKTDDSDRGPEIELVRNPDILMAVKAQREASGYPLVVVGFAAESENLLNNAEAKLQRKGVDLLVANDISAADAGFSVDTNRVIILDADGGQQPLELLHKATVAEMIIDRAAGLLS